MLIIIPYKYTSKILLLIKFLNHNLHKLLITNHVIFNYNMLKFNPRNKIRISQEFFHRDFYTFWQGFQH